MKHIAVLSPSSSLVLAGLAPVAAQDTPPRPGAERPGHPPGHHQRGLRRAGPAERDPPRRRQPQPQGRGIPDGLFRDRVHPREAPRIRHRRLPHHRPARRGRGRPGTPSRPSSGSSSRSSRKIADLKEVAGLALLRAARRWTRRPSSSMSARATEDASTRTRTSRARSSWSTARPRRPGGWASRNTAPLAVDRLVLEPSRVRSRRGRLELPGGRGAEGTKPTVGFMVSPRQGHDLRDALERGQQDRGPGRGQDPDGRGLQGPDDGRPDPGDRVPERGARLHRPPLRGLGQAGRQRQHQRLCGHPGDGPDPAQARWTTRPDPAAQAVRPLPLRPGDLRDQAYLRMQPGDQPTLLRQHQPGHGRRGPDQEPEPAGAHPDALVAADLPQRRDARSSTNGWATTQRNAQEAKAAYRPRLVADRLARSVLLRHRPLFRAARDHDVFVDGGVRIPAV